MKGNLLQGTAKGRMGEIVSKVIHGVQIYSKYQPTVFNPSTTKQVVQRSYFSNAIAFVKTFLTLNISNTQVIPIGSAKNWRVGIIKQSIIAQRINANASYMVSKISALAYSVIDMNRFYFLYGATDAKVLTEQGSSPAEVYFGSNSLLVGNNLTIQQVASEPTASGLLLSSVVCPIELDTPVSENQRKYGFQETVAEVGDWPYVYKMTTILGKVGNSPTEIGTTKPIKFSHLIAVDGSNNVIGYHFYVGAY